MSAPEFPPEWLELREPADAAARAAALLGPLRAVLPPGRLVIRDLGAGTGAGLRWLAPRLPGPQHWVLHDRDPALLARAETRTRESAPSSDDGAPVTVETSQGDITELRAADLADTALVTGSALLDLLTAAEVEALVVACTEAAVPVLLSLSVAGRVEIDPPDPLDAEVAAAFDAHQRRSLPRRGRLLGPDAAAVAATEFRRRGATVVTAPSPWRLGSAEGPLAAGWLRGWCGAAAEQQPELELDGYLRRRLAAAEAGRLQVTVDHVDLLALPGRPA